ncbi:hypothetical protein HUF18_15040 [Thalassolituus sp. ST750PaO-4]|uniref:DUF6160 family protein n=1 Tax=Thalassolituus sp. ST750PaO-4 TaxID=2742965 RepID=UPI001CE29E57|nr:DUF6160 family protein [Thalassolituus sp. ST750PaO-4]MCA6061093.1 hypothetical protein [Thalassolituus sp. ST750PaO-4]
MKFLKKASLAAAIAAASISAQAEMVALDDATMSATTGQAGVTIDISVPTTGITIGQIVYTDTDEGALDTTPKGGSVVMNTLGIKGVYGDTAANQAAGVVGQDAELALSQTIDVDSDGDLVIGMSTDSNVDLGITLADIQLQDSTASTLNSELVSGLSMQLSIGSNSTTRINNVDIATETLGSFGIVGSKMANTASIVIESDMQVAIRDLDVGIFGYTDQQALAVRTAKEAGSVAVGDLDGNGTANESADYDVYQARVAGSSAVTITDLSFNDGTAAKGLVNVSQKIWADADGVNIQMGAINGTLTVGAIGVGGGNVGSLTVSNINLAGLTQTIRGH